MRTDHIVIGSNGFAQVGDVHYHQKLRTETPIVLEHLASTVKVPDCWKNTVRLGTKTFQHDFGSYKEVCLFYYRDELEACDEMAQEDAEEPQRQALVAKNDDFWEYVNKLQAVDLETDELTERIELAYKSIDGNHLSVVKDPPDDAKAVG